jgi:hypothetical protein
MDDLHPFSVHTLQHFGNFSEAVVPFRARPLHGTCLSTNREIEDTEGRVAKWDIISGSRAS